MVTFFQPSLPKTQKYIQLLDIGFKTMCRPGNPAWRAFGLPLDWKDYPCKITGAENKTPDSTMESSVTSSKKREEHFLDDLMDVQLFGSNVVGWVSAIY